MQVNVQRPVEVDVDVFRKAEALGGLVPGDSFDYENAQGGISRLKVCSLYDLPENMTNPYLYCFGGVMTAPFYAMEVLRFYAKQTGKLLEFVSSGKEGNKGLFEKVFYREEGLVCKTEYDSYYAIMTKMCDPEWVYANYEPCEDDSTEGNLIEMYDFAVARGLDEVTYILVTGNPYYDKRLAAEWMLQLKSPRFKDVKVNLVMVHSPIFLTDSRIAVPEARISEIYLGYIAACLGPLAKDTITFEGKTSSAKPERYLMPGVQEADWEEFRDIIVNYSNMGWPDYQKILYGIPHEDAVANVLLSDLFAKTSFAPMDYDYGIEGHLYRYQYFLGDEYHGGDFLTYLRSTNNKRFFE